jgi:hypothetical protein
LEFALMKLLRPLSRIRGRMGAGTLLLAIVATASASAGQVAVAAPDSPAAPAHPAHLAHPAQHAGGGSGGSGNGGVQSTVSWSILPATAKGPDSTRVVFSYGTVKPGSTILDHVEIVNRSKQSAAFSIYATDATGTTLNNALTLLPAGQKPVDIGAWATFPGGAAQLSTVIPGGKAIIEPFTIKVPASATPGDHTGGMIASVGIPHKNSAGAMVVLYQRIAVPMELRVSGAMRAGLQVQSISAGFNDSVNPFGNGSATISYTVANTGNVRQTGTQAVTVTGPFGQAQTVKPAKLPTVLPGDSIRVTVNVGGLFPDGSMNARVTVTPGWPPRTLPLAVSAPVASGSASLFAVPWSLVGLIAALIALGVGIWQYLRWRGREHRLEVAAAAAKARRETERRLLGTRSGNGAEGAPAAAGAPAAQNAGGGPAQAPSGGGADSGSTAE